MRAAVVVAVALGVAFAALVPGASSAAVEVCKNAKYKTLLSKPADGFNPLKWTREDIIAYAKSDVVKPGLPVVVLLALCLLTLLGLLFWRCVRCCCVVCCQQEAFGEADKVLWGRKLRVWKGFMLVFGAACLAIGAWGMYSVPRNLAGEAWAVVDGVQLFADGLADGIDNVSRLATNMTAPLDAVSAVINRDVNPSGLRANISRVAYFLDNAPSPSTFKTAVLALDAGMRSNTGLRGALTKLAALLTGANSPLTALSNYSAATSAYITGGQLTAMDSSLSAYTTAVQDIAAIGNSDPGPSDPRVAALQSAQSALNLSLWVSQTQAAGAAVLGIRGMQNDATTNPFRLVASAIDGLQAATTLVKDDLVPALLGNVTLFNGLFYHNASSAMRGLLDQAIHINVTVVALPADALVMVDSLNSTLVSLENIYAGSLSPITLAGNLSDLEPKLALPPDAAALKAKALTAADALDAAAQALADLQAALANISDLLLQMQPHAASIGSAVASYTAGSGSWANLQNQISAGGNSVVIASSAVSIAASSSGAVGSQLSSTTSELSGLASERATVGAAIADVVADVDASPDVASFVATLDAVQPAYSSLGSPPSQALGGIRSMLDSVEQLQTTTAENIRNQIRAATGPLDNAARQVRTITNQTEGIQTRFQPMVAKYQNYAYGGLLGAYGVVMALILGLMLAAYKNCPGGLCILGALLNIVLVIFCVLPLVYTVAIIALRDGCANVEIVVADAITSGRFGAFGGTSGALHTVVGGSSNATGNGNPASLVLDYYLGDPAVETARSPAEVLQAVVDVAAIKARVNETVGTALADIKRQYNFQPEIASILDSLPSRLSVLFTGVDSAISLLAFRRVRPVYEEVKGLLCCIVADNVYGQWVATLAFAYLAYLTMVTALAVLKKLDPLVDGCCGCVCLDKDDYRPASGDALHRHVSGPPPPGAALLRGVGLASDDAVIAKITVGSINSQKSQQLKSEGSIGSKAGSFIAAASPPASAMARYAVGGGDGGSGGPSAGATPRAPSYEAPHMGQMPSVTLAMHGGLGETGGSSGSPRAYPDLSSIAAHLHAPVQQPLYTQPPYPPPQQPYLPGPPQVGSPQHQQLTYPQIWRGGSAGSTGSGSSPIPYPAGPPRQGSGMLPLSDARAALLMSGGVVPPQLHTQPGRAGSQPLPPRY